MAAVLTIKGTLQPERITGTALYIRAPGRRGRVEELGSVVGGRGAGDRLPVEAAAAATDAIVIGHLIVTLEESLSGATTGGRAISDAPAELIVPKDHDMAYVVLHTDDNGITSWIFPRTVADKLVIELPESSPAPDPNQGGRGPITRAMRASVRVLAWVAQPVLSAGALAVASAWENAKRPYACYQLTESGEFIQPNWDALTTGPALLLIHGTFSSPQAGFSGWVGTDACNKVLARYGNRCIAVAHPSLSPSPDENFKWLARHLPSTFEGPVDVVCHSRGGLFARVLASQQRLSIRRVCQVGAPNLGTPLAQSQHWFAFLDGHTRLLTALPDSATTVLLEGILCVMKLVVTGAGTGLPGIASMEPEGAYLTELGKRAIAPAEWFTVSSDYQPDAQSATQLAKRLADVVVDRFFEEANDVVVPTEGCHLPGPQVTASLRLKGDKVYHCNYFQSPAVHDRLDAWLR